MQVIRRGSKGKAVTFCQERLNFHGFHVTVDGDFGWGTHAAVEQFQASRHLVVDGIVGDKTWDALMLETRAAVPTDLLEDERAELLDSAKKHIGEVPKGFKTKVEKVVTAALEDLGAAEIPDGSNWGPEIEHLVKGYNEYWRIGDSVRRPWCAMAVSSWIRIGLGLKDWDDHPFGHFFGGVSQIESWARKQKEGVVVASNFSNRALPGDIFTMSRGGSGSDASKAVTAGHTGIVLWDDGRYIYTIEGNVSNGVNSKKRSKASLRLFIRWYLA